MLEHGLDFDEVGVVHQPNHPLIPGAERDPMVDMHLDTYFNVAGSGVVVGSELLLKRAQVDVYHRAGRGSYTQDKEARRDAPRLRQEEGIRDSLPDHAGAALICVELPLHQGRDDTRGRSGPHSEEGLGGPREGGQARTRRDTENCSPRPRRTTRDLKDSAQFFPNKKELYQYGVDAYPIALTNLTGGYGGGHCMTAALERG